MNSIVANEIYALRENQYESFIELLYDLKEKTSVNSRQLKILIELDFFSEFGDTNYLLAQYELFAKLEGKSQIRKAKLEEYGLTEDDVRPFAGSETDKTFSKIGMRRLLLHASTRIPTKPRTLNEKIEAQITHLGYIDIIDDRYSGMGVVMSVDTKYAPRFKIYSLKNGTVVECKIDKRTFNKNKLAEGDIIRISSQTKKPKLKRTESGDYEPVPGVTEIWLTRYTKVNNL